VTWIARLKNISAADCIPTKTTESDFVVSVDTPKEQFEKIKSRAFIASELVPVSDWCAWPNSTDMNSFEIDIFMSRLTRFTDMGLGLEPAEQLADRLFIRDRDRDDRTLCFECSYLRKSWRCANWVRAGVAIRPIDANLPFEFVNLMQRCGGFNQVI
jgi:hypothetical protein